MSTSAILTDLNVLYPHINNIPLNFYQEIKLEAYMPYDAICIYNMSHTHEYHKSKNGQLGTPYATYTAYNL